MSIQPLGETGSAEDGTTKEPESAPLSEQQVADYLEADPEFFLRHQDLVARLHLPHGPSGTISLVEHQMAILRSQLDTERKRLTHLIARARDHETLSRRMHALVLQLITAPDLERIESVLRQSLCDEFDAEAVTLKLFPVGGDAAPDDPLVSTFLDFIDRDHALCGPLDEERGTALFGKDSERIRSAALLPIRGETRAGVLAIGSSSPDRFGPEMGTDYLDRLSEVVSRRLCVISQDDA